VKRKTIYSAEYRKLVKRLREKREEQGVTQAELATELGWPQQRLSAIEAGARRLDVFEYFALGSCLGMSRAKALAMIPEPVLPRRGRKAAKP
jgi:transcriptional regulator with XRE-family HTH domain